MVNISNSTIPAWIPGIHRDTQLQFAADNIIQLSVFGIPVKDQPTAVSLAEDIEATVIIQITVDRAIRITWDIFRGRQ